MTSDENLLKYLYKAYIEAKNTGEKTESFQRRILEGGFYKTLLGLDDLDMNDLQTIRDFKEHFSEEQMRMISVIAHMEPKELENIFSKAATNSNKFYQKFDEVEQKILSSDKKNLMQQLVPKNAAVRLNYMVFWANYTREIRGEEVIDDSEEVYKQARELCIRAMLSSNYDVLQYFNNEFNYESEAEKNGVLDINPEQKRLVLAERFFAQEVKKFFDFSNNRQIEELYTLDENYKNSLLDIKEKLLEKSKLPLYQKFAKDDFPYFQDNFDIIKDIFERNQFNDFPDFSPEENHDLRIIDFVKKLYESKYKIWRLKEEDIDLWEVLDILDPTKSDSPVQEYYKTMPTEVKDDIEKIFKFLKDNENDLRSKYNGLNIIDQMYLIIQENLRKKVEEDGRSLPKGYDNSVPSGNKCPTCGEELKKLYDLLKKSEVFSSADMDIIRGFTDITSNKYPNYGGAKLEGIRGLS